MGICKMAVILMMAVIALPVLAAAETFVRIEGPEAKTLYDAMDFTEYNIPVGHRKRGSIVVTTQFLERFDQGLQDYNLYAVAEADRDRCGNLKYRNSRSKPDQAYGRNLFAALSVKGIQPGAVSNASNIGYIAAILQCSVQLNNSYYCVIDQSPVIFSCIDGATEEYRDRIIQEIATGGRP